VTELPDDLLQPEDAPEAPVETPPEEDDPGLSAEESLGLLPPD
jgi:hypothetical protein